MTPSLPSDPDKFAQLITDSVKCAIEDANQFAELKEMIIALDHKIDLNTACQTPVNDLVKRHDLALFGNGKPGLMEVVKGNSSDLKLVKWVGGILGSAILLSLIASILQHIMVSP